MAIFIFSIYCPLKIFITDSCNVFYLMLIKTMETIRKDCQNRGNPHYIINQCLTHKCRFLNRDKDTH